jgi:hypothetical protein
LKKHPYDLPVADTPVLSFPICGAMLAIWHLRPSLQRRFPLHRHLAKDWWGLFAWCVSDGRKDYASLREIPDLEDYLGREVKLPQLVGDAWEGQISLGIICGGMARNRWTLGGLLNSVLARKRAARGFWRGERHARSLPTGRWQLERLPISGGNIRPFLDLIFLPKHDAGLSEAELIQKFGLDDVVEFARSGVSASRESPERLDLPKDVSRFHVPLPLKCIRLLADARTWLRPNPTEQERASVTGLIDTKSDKSGRIQHPFGVNLFGYARGELGIGEDIRQVAKALQACDVPVCIVNFEPGKNISQADRTADDLICAEPKYAFNLFCMTGIETVRYVCERGVRALDGRYNIGLWPWELPDWPESCRHAYACVDEVWGISEYTANAHRFAAPRPVLPMSLPVALGEVGAQTRADFGLPEKAYLYSFAFDVNSSAARKNPEGLIAAFQKAFPLGGKEDVGLVLKISHPETGCKLWRTIRKAAARDARIHLIEKTMRRPELLALFKACDCFVSLHRAEGFGRCLAEALLLGKQLITTGFSGNLDFCHEPRVAVVRHKMVSLKRGDYMWGEGQEWADPDLDHAADLMRSVRENPRSVSENFFPFHPAKIGRRFAVRLQELQMQLENHE